MSNSIVMRNCHKNLASIKVSKLDNRAHIRALVVI